MLINLLFDVNKLNLENQARERLDFASLTACISLLLGNVYHPCRTYRHVSKSSLPSGNNLIATESGGLATLVAAIENAVVDKFTLVINLYTAGVSGNFAGTFGENLIVDAVSKTLNAVLLGNLNS